MTPEPETSPPPEAADASTLAARITAGLDAAMRPVRLLSLVLMVLSCVLLAVLLMISVVDVIKRNTGGSGVHGSIELISVGMVVVVFFALAKSEEYDKHVRTPLVTSRLPIPVAAILRGAGLLVCAGVFVWLTFASGSRALESFDVREVAPGVVKVPIWPARLAIPLGAGLLSLELIHRGLVSIVNFRTARAPDTVEAMGEGSLL